MASDASAAWVAELDGELLGSNFGTRWGSVAFFGPLSVYPHLWDRGMAKQLLAATMERFRSGHQLTLACSPSPGARST